MITQEKPKETESLTIISEANFIHMYDVYYDKVYNYIFFRLLKKEITEDLVSDVFLKLFENRMKYDSKKACLSTWIFTVARNCVADYFKKSKHVAQMYLTFFDDNVEYRLDAEELILDKIEEEYAVKVLKTLKEKEREVIYLKHFMGFSYREIAERINITEKNASVILSRGIKKFKRIFEELYGKE